MAVAEIIVRHCSTIVVSLLMLFSQPAMAAEIYSWKDATGTHFTDNVANVPPEFRKSGKREIKGDIQVVSKSKATSVSKDKTVWKVRCTSCHHTGSGRKGGKRGLASYTMNFISGFQKTPEQVMPSLKKATNGRTTDMKPMNLPDDELLAIARFLLKDQER